MIISKDRRFYSGDTVKHFKGNLYTIICLASDCDDNIIKVVYKDLESGTVWTRNYEDFVGTVNVEGKRIHRFEKYELDCVS